MRLTRPHVLIVCAFSLLASSAWAQDVKIGMIQPLTGSVAASGNFVTQGARLAIDYVNAKGGVLGKKLELIVEDNKSNPSEATAAADKLLSRDKVVALIGAWGSTFTLAVMPKLEEYGVPMIVETASSSKITASGNPWIFRISAPSSMEAKAFSNLVSKVGIKKADFLVVNNDWGRGAAAEFGKMLKEQGGSVGLSETMDPDARDISAQLAKIKSSNSDTLFITTGFEQLSLVFKQMQSLGLNRRTITTGGSQFPDLLAEQVGAAANGSHHILFFVPWFPDSVANPDVAKAYINQWNARGYDKAGLSDGFRGFDAVLVIAAAIEKAGKAESKAIRDALWQVNVSAVNGNISFEKVGTDQPSGQSLPNVYIVQIKDGKLLLLNK